MLCGCVCVVDNEMEGEAGGGGRRAKMKKDIRTGCVFASRPQGVAPVAPMPGIN